MSDNPNAFPLAYADNDGFNVWQSGMELRDYFAAKALAAMISSTDKDSSSRGKAGVTKFAAYAYEYADAMLAQREQS